MHNYGKLLFLSYITTFISHNREAGTTTDFGNLSEYLQCHYLQTLILNMMRQVIVGFLTYP